MKNKTKKPTRSAANSHNGQTAADTNNAKKFEVSLLLVQRSSGRVVIEAATIDEARLKASKIKMREVDDWNVIEDDMFVESVVFISGGQDNE
jgi:hypothetical protein